MQERCKFSVTHTVFLENKIADTSCSAELEQIKAISFKGQFAYGSKRDILSSFPKALELLVEEGKERFIRPMYVGWSIDRDRDDGFDAISVEQK